MKKKTIFVSMGLLITLALFTTVLTSSRSISATEQVRINLEKIDEGGMSG